MDASPKEESAESTAAIAKKEDPPEVISEVGMAISRLNEVLNEAADDVQRACHSEWRKNSARIAAEQEKVAAARARLQEEQGALAAERAEFEAERERAQRHANLGDVVKLNIGGEVKVETRRRVLCQAEHSFLCTLFSGRWEEQVTRDEEGRVFLDFSPEVFMPLLRHLREREMAGPDDFIDAPDIPDHAEGEFRKMLRYLGLEDYLATVWAWNPRDKGEAVQVDGRVVKNYHTQGTNSLIRTKTGIRRGVGEFKIKTLKRSDPGAGYHAIGVATKSAPLNFMPNAPGNHFWGLYLNGTQKVHGKQVSICAIPLEGDHESGTIYHMKIDMNAGTLCASINGAEFRELFSGLPEETLYPALAVGTQEENAYELLI
eukprot:TRINITY_DN18257_c0_g1_i1.p1 TRINITY_DN18257_c0_g1~~TRINITY_DN18257_c0_g1_i1.p1  ORF type:complete len:374 (+),score=81.39 TRINITY_DN18257_c0_g1_i1:89-1210(+)